MHWGRGSWRPGRRCAWPPRWSSVHFPREDGLEHGGLRMLENSFGGGDEHERPALSLPAQSLESIVGRA